MADKWDRNFWRAVPERVLRGAVVGVSAGYFGGDKVFDLMNVNSWKDIGALAISGAFTSLLLSLGGGAISGNGPAFSNNEVVEPPVPPPA